ncbi:lipid-binding SYLF domain-containing protein [Falsiroseomonas oryziterrae]|uniref:lipid-binding SYLF domain-containing protein n=1 Tax=Falsiroseomonas oryziterrae TaxID=2911368 RepID=UPI001F22D495|nr:lipid-binding SYLF domain-containing protein [Roseomonas sp. NPKOSM-4]
MHTRRHAASILAGAALSAVALRPAQAETRAEIDASVNAALDRLRAMPNAEPLLRVSVAQLVFPRILSGGFIVGGQYGEGALVRNGAIARYYQIRGLSVGFLAGAQTGGLAMLFMREEALTALQESGWEVGTGPSVVALDMGLQANVTTTTLTEPVYAISFNQQGLMAALSLNGTRITPFTPRG